MAKDFSLISDKFNTYFKNRKICIGRSIPVSGDYKAGDIIIKENPVEGKSIGWICVADGNPGSWAEIMGGGNSELEDGSVTEAKLSVDVSTKLNKVDSIGVLTELQTASKTNIVSAINEVNNSGQKHKVTENSGYAINVNNGDCNDFKKCGTYMGSTMTNTPLNSDMWFFIRVEAHNDVYCRQEAIPFTDISFGKYERYMLNGEWTEWRSL